MDKKPDKPIYPPRWYIVFTLRNLISCFVGVAFARAFAPQVSPYLGQWWGSVVAYVLGLSLALFVGVILLLLTWPRD